MLAANADRERAADVLRAAYAEGRLTKEEYDYRVGKAMSARTVEELQQLTGDVPHGPMPGPPLPPSYPGRPVPYQGNAVVPYSAPPPPARPYNSASVASLVLAIGSPFTCGVTSLPAVILGHKARGDIRRSGDQGDGLAIAGLALGYSAIGVVLLFFLLAVV
ncbi:DUF1707 and DUF4190 domain-containing protein [Streptomyces sp. HNM0574]|uniref:DUF1707 and DUF4190 domain-containing protein n=1 Tax=Streptomyces sp. HNM0574 TaxID=2714954 RepID=UPI00146E5CB9|nr:DUF1707 and DUF4190 domain-containing protein [Streptomyces sp. HNM0574]NLU66953.1 DUF1707 and DUF4190 domain-containing protein [Streptomyces sp. HNM0574]